MLTIYYSDGDSATFNDCSRRFTMYRTMIAGEKVAKLSSLTITGYLFETI